MRIVRHYNMLNILKVNTETLANPTQLRVCSVSTPTAVGQYTVLLRGWYGYVVHDTDCETGLRNNVVDVTLL